MPIEQCREIIMLYRLRQRAHALISANREAGNRTVAEIYERIDAWLERQLAFVSSGGGVRGH
jgi:hypothetical protein